ncbi:MAG TPA: hypothetical protein VLT33_18720 [Labilithrix sp.]|nr:hypothetical protein [Labilithrix sp.]
MYFLSGYEVFKCPVGGCPAAGPTVIARRYSGGAYPSGTLAMDATHVYFDTVSGPGLSILRVLK